MYNALRKPPRKQKPKLPEPDYVVFVEYLASTYPIGVMLDSSMQDVEKKMKEHVKDNLTFMVMGEEAPINALLSDLGVGPEMVIHAVTSTVASDSPPMTTIKFLKEECIGVITCSRYFHVPGTRLRLSKYLDAFIQGPASIIWIDFLTRKGNQLRCNICKECLTKEPNGLPRSNVILKTGLCSGPKCTCCRKRPSTVHAPSYNVVGWDSLS